MVAYLLLSMLCRFEEIASALNQEPATTEEMDALEKYTTTVEQVLILGFTSVDHTVLLTPLLSVALSSLLCTPLIGIKTRFSQAGQ